MRLYALSCGRFRCRKSIFVPGVDGNEFIESPMPVFFITHPKGNVLFDTGPHPDVFKNAASRWGGLAKVFEPIGDERSGILPQLGKIGISSENIKFVVNSHLHFDHARGNQFFTQATFLVSKQEIECARKPENEGKGYFKEDWSHPLNYQEIEGELDIFGDRRLIIMPMPGHTFGHQIMLVKLKQSGTIVLSGDSVPCRENFVDFIISRNNMDNDKSLLTIQKLHKIVENERAFIIHGHDPSQWGNIKLAPDYFY